MIQKFLCQRCHDTGEIGFVGRKEQSTREAAVELVGVLWAWFWLLIVRRTCPACNGNPRSLLPARPASPRGSHARS